MDQNDLGFDYDGLIRNAPNEHPSSGDFDLSPELFGAFDGADEEMGEFGNTPLVEELPELNLSVQFPVEHNAVREEISQEAASRQGNLTLLLRCPVCWNFFSRLDVLKRHFDAHHMGDDTFQCNLCRAHFSKRVHVAAHQKKRTVKGTNECPHCLQKLSAEVSQMKNHVTSHHSPNASYRCIVCIANFILPEQLVSHMREIHPEIKEAGVENIEYQTDEFGRTGNESFAPQESVDTLHTAINEMELMDLTEPAIMADQGMTEERSTGIPNWVMQENVDAPSLLSQYGAGRQTSNDDEMPSWLFDEAASVADAVAPISGNITRSKEGAQNVEQPAGEHSHLPLYCAAENLVGAAKDLAKHRCTLCFYPGKTLWQLQMHMKDHSSGNSVKCGFCSVTFASVSGLRAHGVWNLRVSVDGGTRECSHCLEAIPNVAGEMDRHIASHHLTKRGHHCRVCIAVFRTEHMLGRHMVVVHGGQHTERNVHVGFYAENLSSTEHGLDVAASTMQAERTAAIRAQRMAVVSEYHARDGPHRCISCIAQFRSAAQLSAHHEAVHGLPSRAHEERTGVREITRQSGPQRPYQRFNLLPTVTECLKCMRSFSNPYHVQKHVKGAHPPNAHIPCRFCKATFSSKRYLATHQQPLFFLYARESPGCPHCRKPVRGSLKDHVREYHDAPQQVLCTICPAAFRTNDQLAEHVHEQHPGAHPEEAGVQYERMDERLSEEQSKRELRGVIRRAQPQQPDRPTKRTRTHVVCPHCLRTFQDKCALSEHSLGAHPENASLQCLFCTATFGSARHLRQHSRPIVNFPGSTTHHCPHCRASVPGLLRLHNLDYHDAPMQALCELCPAVFRTDAQLACHVREQHADGPVPTGTRYRRQPPHTEKTGSQPPPLGPDDARRLSELREKRKRTCPKCWQTISSRKRLREHDAAAHHPLADVPCPYCRATFGTRRHLTDHSRGVRRSAQREPACPHCRAPLGDVCLDDHNAEFHAHPAMFFCTHCPAAFRTTDQRAAHGVAQHPDGGPLWEPSVPLESLPEEEGPSSAPQSEPGVRPT